MGPNGTSGDTVLHLGNTAFIWTQVQINKANKLESDAVAMIEPSVSLLWEGYINHNGPQAEQLALWALCCDLKQPQFDNRWRVKGSPILDATPGTPLSTMPVKSVNALTCV